MSEYHDPNDDNIINLSDKRRHRRRRLTIGAVKERFHARKNDDSKGQDKQQPVWFVYLQFFLLLFFVAWLMRQCGH